MITIGILSYNMPNLTDALYAQLKELVKIPVNYIVLDNGSDIDKVAKSTTHTLEINTKLTGGMNEILNLAQGSDYVWLCTNDIRFNTVLDPVESLISKIQVNADIGVIHPSIIKPVPNYAYPWMLAEGKTGVSIGHKMVDIIAPLYTKKALDYNHWHFDDRFTYGWGIDVTSCYITRKNGLQIAIDHDIILEHQTSAVYDSGNDKEFKNRQEYYKKALAKMHEVFLQEYGENWREILYG